MPDPSTRIAVVTGMSSGIGDAVACDLATRGWRVVGISRRPGTVVDHLLSSPNLKRFALINRAANPGLRPISMVMVTPHP